MGMLVLADSGGKAGQVAVLQPAEAVGLLSRCHFRAGLTHPTAQIVLAVAVVKPK